jgi:hypothetical protein
MRFLPGGSRYSGIGPSRLVLVEIIRDFEYRDATVKRGVHMAYAGTFAWASFARGDDWVTVYIGDPRWIGEWERHEHAVCSVNVRKQSHSFTLTDARRYIRSIPGTVHALPDGIEWYEGELPEPTVAGAGE